MRLRSTGCAACGRRPTHPEKVHRPGLVLAHRRGQQHSSLSADPPSPLASVHDQLLFHVDPVHLLAVHHPAFPPQQNMQPPISPAASIFGQLPQSERRSTEIACLQPAMLLRRHSQPSFWKLARRDLFIPAFDALVEPASRAFGRYW
jgi:hypothetical protein